MKRIVRWIRIVCVCILVLGLLGCVGSCAKGTDDPAEIVPASAAPENNEPDTITEDEVVSNSANGGSDALPTLPPETEAPTVTEAPEETATPTPEETEDPFSFETPEATSTPGPSDSPNTTATPTPNPSDNPTDTPEPTADDSPVALPPMP